MASKNTTNQKGHEWFWNRLLNRSWVGTGKSHRLVQRFLLTPLWLLAMTVSATNGNVTRNVVAQDLALSARLSEAQLNLAENDVLARLEHVTEFLRDNQWREAVQTMRQVMGDHADSLIEAPNVLRSQQHGISTFIPLPEYCQLRIAAWADQAPEAMGLYRQQVDSLASHLFEQAVAQRDQRRLQEIVDEFLLSSIGDKALLQLGSVALERGDYSLARKSWERINPLLRTTSSVSKLLGCSPGCSWWSALQGRNLDTLWPELSSALQGPGNVSVWLAYPDSEIPLAAVRARLTMVSILEGSIERAEMELAMLRRLHPTAEGSLAGRQGIYHEIVASELEASKTWAPVAASDGWPTLTGSNCRNFIAADEIDIPRRPAWQVALPRLSAVQDQIAAGRTRVSETTDGLLSYHLAADQGQVFIHQPGLLRGLNVRTGEPLWPVNISHGSLRRLKSGAFFEMKMPANGQDADVTYHTGVPRYCVSTCGNYLIARMGQAWTKGRADDESYRTESRIVGFDLRTQKLLFNHIKPDEPGWEFEAAPIIHGARIYVGLRRQDSVNAQMRVACYAVETGQPVWITQVVSAEAIGGEAYDYPNSVLSLKNGLLLCNTCLGAVAAIRADDGHLCWVSRYPRFGFRHAGTRRDDRHLFRDLCPTLIAGELAIAAPSDSDRIFAFQIRSGRLVWATAAERAVDAVHLLGVANGCLLAGGNHLYWIDARSGKFIGQFPPPGSPNEAHAAPAPRGYGRGLLASNYVYWPTRQEIRVFDQRSPIEVRQPIQLGTLGVKSGNLLIHDGMLLIVGDDQLTAFQQVISVDQPDLQTRSTSRRPAPQAQP